VELVHLVYVCKQWKDMIFEFVRKNVGKNSNVNFDGAYPEFYCYNDLKEMIHKIAKKNNLGKFHYRSVKKYYFKWINKTIVSFNEAIVSHSNVGKKKNIYNFGTITDFSTVAFRKVITDGKIDPSITKFIQFNIMLSAQAVLYNAKDTDKEYQSNFNKNLFNDEMEEDMVSILPQKLKKILTHKTEDYFMILHGELISNMINHLSEYLKENYVVMLSHALYRLPKYSYTTFIVEGMTIHFSYNEISGINDIKASKSDCFLIFLNLEDLKDKDKKKIIFESIDEKHINVLHILSIDFSDNQEIELDKDDWTLTDQNNATKIYGNFNIWNVYKQWILCKFLGIGKS